MEPKLEFDSLLSLNQLSLNQLSLNQSVDESILMNQYYGAEGGI